MKTKKIMMVVLCLLVGIACKKNKTTAIVPVIPIVVPPVTAPSTASVDVDCGVALGEIKNSLYARSNITFTGGTVGSTPLKTTDNNFLLAQGVAKEACRLFISVNTVKDFGLGNYDAYVQDASRVSKEMLIVVSGSISGTVTDLAMYKTLLRQILVHYKAIAPNIVYIEATNEYDLFVPAISDATYYNTYYKTIYQEVNYQNTLLAPGAKPFQVGGPCLGQWNPTKMENFIKNFGTDTDPSKKLDFISYHEYCSWNTAGVTNADHLIDLGSRRGTLRGWLSANGLNSDLPIFITEHGIFPGNKLRETGSPYTVAAGMLMGAASAATYNYYYVNAGNNQMMPFLWDARFNEYPEKSMLANIDIYPVNTPTTFGNTILALAQMETQRVQSTAEPVANATGLGVYAMATVGTNKVTILIWNWQHRGTTTHTIDLAVSRLPAAFTGKKVTMTKKVIDAQTSNFLYNVATASLQTVETNADFNTAKYTLTLAPNVVSLITLTVTN